MKHKIGAGVYVLWGLLHLLGSANAFVFAAEQETGVVQGRLYQNAWNIAFFGIFAIVVAVAMNWKNSRTGYWLNLITIGIADLGFVIFVVLPGYISLRDGLLGPVLWLLAAVFSTLGLRSEKTT